MKIFIGRDTKTIRLKFGGNYKAYIEHGMMTEWDTTVINWTPNGSVIAEVIRELGGALPILPQRDLRRSRPCVLLPVVCDGWQQLSGDVCDLAVG